MTYLEHAYTHTLFSRHYAYMNKKEERQDT